MSFGYHTDRNDTPDTVAMLKTGFGFFLLILGLAIGGWVLWQTYVLFHQPEHLEVFQRFIDGEVRQQGDLYAPELRFNHKVSLFGQKIETKLNQIQGQLAGRPDIANRSGLD